MDQVLPKLDENTKTALALILSGQGPGKNGDFVVTVRGGQIISFAAIGSKVTSAQIEATRPLLKRTQEK